MRSHLLALVAASTLAACGPTPGGPKPPVTGRVVPPDVIALAPWEIDWTRDEYDTWREGVVTESPPEGAPAGAAETPLAGATVDLLVPPPQSVMRPPVLAASVTTGADGSFRIGPSPAGSWLLRVRKDGFAPVWLGESPSQSLVGTADPPPGPRYPIRLRRSRDVPGRVTDHAGAPLPAVKLVASSPGYREELAVSAEGRFVAHPPPGKFLLQSEDPRHVAEPVVVNPPVTGDAPEVRVFAKAAETLKGWVTTLDGARIRNAVVVCADEPSVQTRTDAEGRYEIPVLPHQFAAAFSGDFGWRTWPVPRAGERHFWLEPSAGLSGTVVDIAGRPVEDARLYAVVIGFNGLYERVFGPRSRADGTFDFSWLPRPPRGVANPVRIFARKRGAGESGILTVAADRPGAESDVTVRLLGAREVKGVALRADGTPAVGALLTANWGHWDGGITPREVEALSILETAMTHADAAGRFRFASLPLGLHAKIRCQADDVVLEKFVDPIPPGEPVEFRFEGGRALAGKVTAADGSVPEGDVSVEIQLVDTPGVEVRRAVTAQPDGSFRFEDLTPGRYQVTARGAKYDLAGGGVKDAGDLGVVVALQRSASVVVKLVFEGGTPPDVPLRIALTQIEGGAQEFRKILDAGRGGEPVEWRGIWPGPRRLEVSGDVWRGLIERLEIGDGEQRVIELPVRRTLRIAAKLVDSGGQGVARQLIVLAPLPPTVGVQQLATSGEGGALDLTGLTPGRWRAQSDVDGHPPMRQEFDVLPGDNPPLELRLLPAGTLVVRVDRPDGAPMEHAVVVLTDAKGAAVNAWGDAARSLSNLFPTQADGKATIRGVRAGTVRVEVRSGPATLDTRDVEIVAGRETVVEVR